MHQAGHPHRVRELIREIFLELGANPMAKEMESLLIRSGAYCGHRIDKDGFRAIWFIEEDQIKFYDRSGSLARSLAPSAALAKKAA